MLRSAIMAACGTVCTLGVAAEPGYFEFPLKWDDVSAGVITDAAFLNSRPAGVNGRVVARDGRFVEEGTGRRIRFLGANIGADEAFPERADAELIARRLAKAGVNIVRLHHLDNPWAIQSGGSIFDPKRPDRQVLDPAQLDKLDYLVHCLKEQGIFVNLNLKVSKELTEADLPGITKVTYVHQKRIDFFQDRMIELQKDYARKLLGHRNAYTKMTYAEDPAVAVVEINNENSLVGFWTNTLGKELDKLPQPFKTELEGKWTAWLKAKYQNDAALVKAWVGEIEELGESIIRNGQAWQAESHENARMDVVQSGGAEDAATSLHVKIGAVSGTDWHLQIKLEGLTLVEGRTYTLSFTGRADRELRIRGEVRKDIADWHNMGLSEEITLGKEPKQYEFSFQARDVEPNHARVSFSIGGGVGELWITNLKLAPGARNMGLKEGESLAGRISIPGAGTKTQLADWIHFLADTERKYADEMLTLLRDELKVQANIALTQVDYGGTTGLNREQRMDFADTHAYWQHPTFPAGASWSPQQWTIRNTPQVAEMSEKEFGSIGHLAIARVAGKPFAVSEYDHPAPSDYVSEMMPTFATFGCIQDWDAIYTFATADYSSERKPDRILGFFDQNNHPAKWGFYPSAAVIFRQGLIEPAGAVATVRLPAPLWSTNHMFAGMWQAVLGGQPYDFLKRRLQVSDQPLPAGEKARLEVEGTPGSTGEIVNAKAGKVLTAHGPAAAVFTGYIGGAELSAGGTKLVAESFESNFASATVVAMDGKPLAQSQRVLVTIAGRVQNQEMGWNETRTSVSDQWGKGPTVAQFVPATFSIPADGPRRVYALDSTGARRGNPVSASHADGMLTFRCAPEHATLLYEIAGE